jgi:hypothetical protein
MQQAARLYARDNPAAILYRAYRCGVARPQDIEPVPSVRRLMSKCFKQSHRMETFMLARTLLATAALAIVMTGSAHAGFRWNGPILQGAKFNGVGLNGPVIQGTKLNGVGLNGPVLQGAKFNGTRANGSRQTVGDHEGGGLNGQVIAIEF